MKKRSWADIFFVFSLFLVLPLGSILAMVAVRNPDGFLWRVTKGSYVAGQCSRYGSVHLPMNDTYEVIAGGAFFFVLAFFLLLYLCVLRPLETYGLAAPLKAFRLFLQSLNPWHRHKDSLREKEERLELEYERHQRDISTLNVWETEGIGLSWKSIPRILGVVAGVVVFFIGGMWLFITVLAFLAKGQPR